MADARLLVGGGARGRRIVRVGGFPRHPAGGIVRAMDETPSPDTASQPDQAATGTAAPGATEPDPSVSVEPAFDALGQPIPARSFDPALDESTRAFGSSRPTTTLCPWCNRPLPDPDAETCPHCGAALKPVQEDLAIPGLTVSPVDPREALAQTSEQLAAYAVRTPESIAPDTDRPEFEPPSPEVRRKMLEMELEAQGLSAQEAAQVAGEQTGEHTPETGPASDDATSEAPGSGGSTIAEG